MDQLTVVYVDRWSLYRGALVPLRWPMEKSTEVTIYRQVVFIRLVSLYNDYLVP